MKTLSNPGKAFMILLFLFLLNGCRFYYYRPWKKINACGAFEQTTFEPDTAQWHLVVISSPTCGYCWIAKSYFAKRNMAQKIPITWVEYDPPSASYMEKAEKNNWYTGSNILLLNDCYSKFELFPTFILYRKGKSHPVWIHRGWDPDVISKLLRKTQARQDK